MRETESASVCGILWVVVFQLTSVLGVILFFSYFCMFVCLFFVCSFVFCCCFSRTLKPVSMTIQVYLQGMLLSMVAKFRNVPKNRTNSPQEHYVRMSIYCFGSVPCFLKYQ